MLAEKRMFMAIDLPMDGGSKCATAMNEVSTNRMIFGSFAVRAMCCSYTLAAASN